LDCATPDGIGYPQLLTITTLTAVSDEHRVTQNWLASGLFNTSWTE